MKHFSSLSLPAVAALFVLASALCWAQTSATAQTSPMNLTWEQVKAKFEAANPALRADALSHE